jgi:succinyl-CoA synthetase beta subunit
LHAAYRLFIEKDCSQVEINPLAVTKGGDVVALDAKLGFDDNALFRHKEIQELQDPSQEDPRDLAAAEHHLNYIGLEGNIGCMVNGAGLAMATLDLIQAAGVPCLDGLGARGGNLHRTDEFIELESLSERATLLALLLLRVSADTGKNISRAK